MIGIHNSLVDFSARIVTHRTVVDESGKRSNASLHSFQMNELEGSSHVIAIAIQGGIFMVEKLYFLQPKRS